jgi:hypothetical protein
MRRSTGHVDGERKTWAVANRHDFAALTRPSRVSFHQSPVKTGANIKPPHQTRCVTEALARLERVFVETPGVRLTAAAAAQKAGLDRQVCRIRLLRLTETGFLEQRLRGVFGVRPLEAPLP